MSAPTPFVLLNGQLIPAADAQIPATCDGFLYGHGLFETIKITQGRTAWLPQHLARLTASAHALNLNYSAQPADLAHRINQVVTANHISEGAVKVVIFNQNSRTAGELISLRDNPYTPETYARGFRLRTQFSGERTGTLTEHKTLNYLANIRAKRAALATGFDESLFLTPAGLVMEGATTNLFIVRGETVYTPALACGPLPGIARAQVIQLLGPSRIRETLLTHDEITHATEAFVTNALLGVMPVSLIDTQSFNLSTNPITRSLTAAYQQLESRSLS